MPIRDILVLTIILGSVPLAIRRPYVGALMWVWVGVMNPHRLGWGFAFDFPVGWVVAAATLVGVFFSRDEKHFKGRPEVYALALFAIWTCETTFFSLNPEGAWPMWIQVAKTQLMVFVVLLVLNEKRHVMLLIWVLVGSLGYYGIKGGIFAFTTSAEYLVYGPPGSAIDDNNALALAECMNIPLIYFLLQQAQKKWIKVGLAAGMAITALAILSSQSRGALLAIGAMAVFLWWKSPHRLALTLFLPIVATAGLLFMPEHWWARMDTISNYEADQSAMERVWAWKMALNLVADRPLVGGGFALWTPEVYARYAQEWLRPQNSHSVYFQVLGEHGFIGLLLWLLIWFLTWRDANWLIRRAQKHAELKWAALLAAMIQVSLVAYAVGGAFLNLAYWDVPYYLLVALVVARYQASKRHTPSDTMIPKEDGIAGMRADPELSSTPVGMRSKQLQ
jgi:probable O-glycosylation ligase (exosortase A-associated)